MLLETLITICTSHKETEKEREGGKRIGAKIESALQKGEWNSVIANSKDVLHW